MRYSEAKREIKTGDVLLFRGHPLRSFYSAAIRLRTASKYTHVGLALWLRINGSKLLACIEAREQVGLRIMPMTGYLEQCRSKWCRVDWYQLDDTIDREAVVGHALKRWKRLSRYPSWRKMIASFGYLVPFMRYRFGLPADADPNTCCCSELVAEAMAKGGYDFSEVETRPARTAPGEIALYTCLRRRGELQLDTQNCDDTDDQDQASMAGAAVI